MLQGLTTVTFWVDDVAAAAEWYEQFLGVPPYFVRPQNGPPAYVEFRVGPYEHELGLIDREFAPAEPAYDAGGAIAYWPVDDVAEALQRLLGYSSRIRYRRGRRI